MQVTLNSPLQTHISTLSLFLRPNRISQTKPTSTLIRCTSSQQTNMNPPKSKRVVVVGGGVIGVCTAYFLAEKGADVTIIEKSSVACAASGKAGGFLALDWCDGGSLSKLARASFNLHGSLAEELNGKESYGYRPLTTLSLTVTELDTSTGNQNRNLPSWINGPSQSAREIGSTSTTAQVHPELFTKTLVNVACERHGVDVVIGKVERVVVGEDGGVKGVAVEGGGVVDADAVVLAMGPWSGKFEMVRSLFRVYGLRAHSIVVEPKEREVITPHALFLSYYPNSGGPPMDPEVYPRPTGEVYICGMSSEVDIPDNPEEIVGDPASIAVLKRVAKTVSTHLDVGAEARVKAEQACFLPCTDDSVPVIGELPGVKGCYVATGHSCWGILNGPATGAAMAELVVEGRASIVDLTRFSPARFVARRKA